MVKPSKKREVIKYLRDNYKASIEGCCSIVKLSRRSWYNQPKKDDTEVLDALNGEIKKKPNRGFDYLFNRLIKEGYKWSRNKVLRVYRENGLVRRAKKRKRLPDGLRKPLMQQDQLNEVWSMDFMSDGLMDGRSIRVLNIIDDCNRECIVSKGSLSYPSERVVRELEELKEIYGVPQSIRTDNGPEFISKAYKVWCKKNNVMRIYSEPGRPMQNGYVERFNRTFREDVLDANLFINIAHVNILAEEFKVEYNKNHPHKSLGRKSPIEFAERSKLTKHPKQDILNYNL